MPTISSSVNKDLRQRSQHLTFAGIAARLSIGVLGSFVTSRRSGDSWRLIVAALTKAQCALEISGPRLRGSHRAFPDARQHAAFQTPQQKLRLSNDRSDPRDTNPLQDLLFRLSRNLWQVFHFVDVADLSNLSTSDLHGSSLDVRHLSQTTLTIDAGICSSGCSLRRGRRPSCPIWVS
jgi:hypothetical protein